MPSRPRDPELLDTRLLRLFDLLASTGSVTRAAERLGLSQPTVSIWLGKLRRWFDDELFVRTPDGMLPTPRAVSLLPTVRTALDAYRQLSAQPEAFDPAVAQRSFRICMTDASHVTLLPQILSHLRALAPGVRLDALRIDADMPRALQSGDADLAIGLIPQLEAGFYQQTLFSQDWVCLANGAHPRIGTSLSLRQYRDEGHILIGAGTGHALQVEALKRQRVERRIMLELPGFLGLPVMLSTTDLIVTLPRQIGETLARSAGLKVLTCPVRIPAFKVKQHWHARYQHDPANQWLRLLCARLFMRATGPAPRRPGA